MTIHSELERLAPFVKCCRDERHHWQAHERLEYLQRSQTMLCFLTNGFFTRRLPREHEPNDHRICPMTPQTLRAASPE